MKKVLLSEKIDDAGINLLKDNGFEVKIAANTDALTMAKEIEDAYAVIMRSSELPAEVIDAGKQLKIISRNGTGINNVNVDEATKKGILVAKVNGANAFSVAEYVITTMLMLSRKLMHTDKLLHEKQNKLTGMSLPGFSTKYNLNGNELAGKTLAILGYGKIGQQIWPIADFISINMPLTPETKDTITAKELKSMKNSAFVINSARGGIINENDLATALNNDEIAGAAIDAFSSEPPKPNNPLFNSKNTIITSHVAGTTKEANRRLGLGAAQAVIDFSNGKMPEFPVNPEVGVSKED